MSWLQTGSVTQAIDSQALTTVADASRGADDSVMAHAPMPEAKEPIALILASGAMEASTVDATADVAPATVTLLVDVGTLVLLPDVEEPIGQEAGDATTRGPSPPQEQLPTVEPTAPAAHETVAPSPDAVSSTIDMAATSPMSTSELSTAHAPSPLCDITATTSAAVPAATTEALTVATSATTPTVPPSPPPRPFRRRPSLCVSTA